jgi:hypothetical protein
MSTYHMDTDLQSFDYHHFLSCIPPTPANQISATSLLPNDHIHYSNNVDNEAMIATSEINDAVERSTSWSPTIDLQQSRALHVKEINYPTVQPELVSFGDQERCQHKAQLDAQEIESFTGVVYCFTGDAAYEYLRIPQTIVDNTTKIVTPATSADSIDLNLKLDDISGATADSQLKAKEIAMPSLWGHDSEHRQR